MCQYSCVFSMGCFPGWLRTTARLEDDTQQKKKKMCISRHPPSPLKTSSVVREGGRGGGIKSLGNIYYDTSHEENIRGGTSKSRSQN